MLGYVGAVWSSITAAMRSSSLIDYGRLIVSDPDIVFAHAKAFFLGFLEAFPADAVVALCVTGLILMGILVLAYHALKAARTIRSRTASVAFL